MRMMSGSPVLTDDRFDNETAAVSLEKTGASPGASPGLAPPTSYSVMTVGGSITATVVLLILLVGAAAFGWSQVVQGVPRVSVVTGEVVTSAPSIPSWIFVAMIAGLVLGLVTSFKPKLARITAPLYSLAMGSALGAISAVYNNYYNGIVTQAVFATVSILTVMLFLYATRIIKVTNRFVMIVVGATMGIFVMYLVSFVLSLFGAQLTFLNDGSPLGILISVGIIIIAALNLAIDFAFIEKASQHQVPKYMEWYGAFGIVVTLVWIYLEVLRLLAMLNRR
jgi:uncharacterized YccA/Bax inhibitor family protein